jgi:hypothetical protein
MVIPFKLMGMHLHPNPSASPFNLQRQTSCITSIRIESDLVDRELGLDATATSVNLLCARALLQHCP